MNKILLLPLFFMLFIRFDVVGQNEKKLTITDLNHYLIHGKDNGYVKTTIKSLALFERSTLVWLDITATQNSRRGTGYMHIGKDSYIKSATAYLPIVNVEEVFMNGDTRDCDAGGYWWILPRWGSLEMGKRYCLLLTFLGRIPEGETLVDISIGGVMKSTNVSINNPITHPKRDEAWCKANINKNNDGICGIYEGLDRNKDKLACVKIDGKYTLIYLGGIEDTWWFIGERKTINIEETATYGVFKAEYVKRSKVIEDVYLSFEGSGMEIHFDYGTPSSYIKMYPTASQNSTIDGERNSTEWTGTGFALMNNYIVTNYHVVEDAKSIFVHGINGNFNNQYNASVVATDKNNDIAILKVNGVTIFSTSIPYAIKTSTVEVGEDVFVLGYPLTDTMGEEIKLTTGVISSRTGFQGDVSLYQISAPIQPGNSGGPLLDSRGNVIGIVCAAHKGAENVGYAIKASYLKNLMESTVSFNILPQNNKISTLSLSEKVKAVKNHVYYITCSNLVSNNDEYSSHNVNSSISSGNTNYN